MKKNFLLIGLLLCTALVNAQDKEPKIIQTEIIVGGVCEMCETRIEKAVDVKGVKAADYDLDTHVLSITYATKFISEEDIHRLLNEVGHDTDKSIASDAQYDSVHNCCKYRGHEDH